MPMLLNARQNKRIILNKSDSNKKAETAKNKKANAANERFLKSMIDKNLEIVDVFGRLENKASWPN